MPVAGPEVVTLGECLVSFVGAEPGSLAGTTTFRTFAAGAEANVAVGLARLGRRVAFIGRVGDDGLGLRIVRALRAEGVDVAGLTVDPSGPTGLMIRERHGFGPSEVVYARTGSAGSRIGPEDVAAAEARGVFATAAWLHLTGITPALSASARAAVDAALDGARATGATASLDVNLRRRLWTESEARTVLCPLLGRIDVVIADLDEAAVVCDLPGDTRPADLAAALLRLGPTLAVLKLGADGAVALGAAGESSSAPGLPVPAVVDPVGAGDAFCAGFIDARLAGRDLADALARANACGASAVSAVGDQTGMPSAAELDRLVTGAASDTLR